MSYPIKTNAIRVKQPFGEFFILSMKAIDLLEVTFSDALRYDENQMLRGSQRALDEKRRVNEITDYINSQDLAFPNSIILAANYNQDGFIEDNDEIKWKVEELSNGYFEIEIPTDQKLAAIIDGQHRLNGFKNATEARKKNTDIVVSVYFDLPAPYQAYLFASINYNQKPVNKSLALEQFGYLTELTPPDGWSPELLGVFLTRNLNLDRDSCFYNHIKVSPQNDHFLLELDPKEQDWLVSTATIVDGIMKLITNNPKRDSNVLNGVIVEKRNRNLLSADSTPLRQFYLNKNDRFIYLTVLNFFNSASEILFANTSNGSFIKKTVGIQALFGVLRTLLTERLEEDKNISVKYFDEFILKARHVNFSDNFFTASGIGKSRIQNCILICIGFKRIDDIKNESDRPHYERLLSSTIQ